MHREVRRGNPGSNASRKCIAASFAAAAVLSLPATLAAAEPTLRADGFYVTDRVAIKVADNPTQAALHDVQATLNSKFTAARSGSAPATRVIEIAPAEDGTSGVYAAIIHDYTTNESFSITCDAQGNELSRERIDGVPLASDEEYADAAAVVQASPTFAAQFAKGELICYEPMPPASAGSHGERLVHVGVATPGMTDLGRGFHEIVGVSLGTGSIVRFAAGAPPTAIARGGACGPPIQSPTCSPSLGTATSYTIQWPAVSPKWEFTMTRPRNSQPNTFPNHNGSGLELTDIKYNGQWVMKRASVPILNVQYTGDVCGPYRDWLDSEDCFAATGTAAIPGQNGIIVASSAPSTICESQSDIGNFKGVAIYDEGQTLWLATECNAGWYRYITQWRFGLDGSIQPIFGFSAVQDSCVCDAHHHHAYWRFDMVPGSSVTGDTATGNVTVSRGGPGQSWSTISTETKTTRPSGTFQDDWYRVRQTSTGFGYTIIPSPIDGSASGVSFAKGDNWILAYSSTQLSDGRYLGDATDQSINIDPWINGQAVSGATPNGRVVLWNRAGYVHDVDTGGALSEICLVCGPKMIFNNDTTTAVITIEANQPGDIFVDGVLKGNTTWTGPVATGFRTISFGAVGGYVTPSNQNVNVADGSTPPRIMGNYAPVGSGMEGDWDKK